MQSIIDFDAPSSKKYVSYIKDDDSISLFNVNQKRPLNQGIKKDKPKIDKACIYTNNIYDDSKKSVRDAITQKDTINLNKSCNTDTKMYKNSECQTDFIEKSTIGVSTDDFMKYIEKYKINFILNVNDDEKNEYKKKIAEIHGNTYNMEIKDE